VKRRIEAPEPIWNVTIDSPALFAAAGRYPTWHGTLYVVCEDIIE
jgi:hypothetical protein